jgi:colicin import membrane protein
MDTPRRNGDERDSRLGYTFAIIVSAIGHVGIILFAIFVLPNLLHSDTTPPPTYTVKIVDNIPAGDLGTHLPKLSHRPKPPPAEKPPPQQVAKAEEVKPPAPPVEPPKPDENAIALKTAVEPSATPTPPVAPPPVVEPTPEPTAAPTPKKVAEHHQPKPPEKTKVQHKVPKAKQPPVMLAKNDKPNIQEQLAKIRQQLMTEHLKEQAQDNDNDEDDDDSDDNSQTASNGPSGSGPVTGPGNLNGQGYGVGPGTGSAGILQDQEFLTYYQTVENKIKNAWIFPGGSNDLTAQVDFAIGPDGNLTELKLTQGSGDGAFDDSVLRAIRKAAPFPAPPDKFKREFAGGVNTTFKLGELKS